MLLVIILVLFGLGAISAASQREKDAQRSAEIAKQPKAKMTIIDVDDVV